MSVSAKSYWLPMSLDGERSRQACLSYFEPLADGMTPHKAEILCDIETDREKKLRMFAKDADGDEYKFERTLGAKFSIRRSRVIKGASE